MFISKSKTALICLTTLLTLTACSSNFSKEVASTDQGAFMSDTGIHCDKTSDSVILTLSGEALENNSKDNAVPLSSIISEALCESSKENADGSVSYILTDTQHAVLLDTLRETLNENLTASTCSESFPDIIKLEANDTFDEFVVVTTNDTLSAAEKELPQYLTSVSRIYAAYSGDPVEQISVEYKSSTSGEMIEISSYSVK